MPKIVPIIEGDGEVTAVPKLLYRILQQLNRYDIHVSRPKNAHGRSNLTVAGGLEKFIRLAAKDPDCGAILVLLDAENDCPKDLARNLSERSNALGINVPIVIVCANHMYETWLVASIETIAGRDLEGRPGLPQGLQPPEDVEVSIGNAKRWLDALFQHGRAYKETEDQAAMTRLLDTELVRQRSRSFRRLWHALEQAIEAIDQGSRIVTPIFVEDA